MPTGTESSFEDKKNPSHQFSIQHVEFSGPTYQISVFDEAKGKEEWVFLQLSQRGKIKDSFCTCEDSESPNACAHIQAAYQYLFDKEALRPLHERFESCFWNALCMILEERLGDDPQAVLKKEKQAYISIAETGKVLFLIEAKEEKTFQEWTKLIFSPRNETEETSLKFSNLSDEEIDLWKKGEPEKDLRYRLSFWNDIAKFMLSLQESGQSYELSFRYSKKGIPNWVEADFKDFKIGFYLSKARLESLIASFATVSSPLKVYHEGDEGIEKIVYSKEEQTLYVIGKKEKGAAFKEIPNPEEGIEIGEWLFVPGEGFYAFGMHELLKCPRLEGENIAVALNEHGALIAKLLENDTIHFDPIPLKYDLFFDSYRNFHIEAYLFEKGDLFSTNSWLQGLWGYVEGKGFFLVEKKEFPETHKTVQARQVAQFIEENKIWLNNQEGFQTHLKSVEFEISYELVQNRRLVFKKKTLKRKKEARQLEFGDWTYLEGKGFYAKKEHVFSFLLESGFSIPAAQIPLFIKMNREELELIPHFFSTRPFVKSVGLKASYLGKRKIELKPTYELVKGLEKDLKIFEDCAYLEEEGFYELPFEMRLPEKFDHAQEIQGQDLIKWIQEDVLSLKRWIKESDEELIFPEGYKLIIEEMYQSEKGRGWYEIEGAYETEKGSVEVHEVYKDLSSKYPYGFYKAGLFDFSLSFFDWLRQLKKDRWSSDKKRFTVSSLEFMRLQAFLPCEVKGGNKETKEVFDKLYNLTPPKDPDLQDLKSVLRPYQKNGVYWLWFLYSECLSGLLCDDMGLGKTHQTMGLLASVYRFIQEHAEGTKRLFLIICPTSVLYHWEEKLKEFLPSIKVHLFHGLGRSKDELKGDYDLILTSYGILRNEREALSSLSFEVAIFDEIQVAKNQYSLIYLALGRIKAQMKIGLTGTPIENRLRELKSLFDLILPGYMPKEAPFRDFFIKPIEKEGNKEKKAELNRLIHPFVLRRTKASVLLDLPDKIETTSHADLIGFQKELYDKVLLTKRHQLLEELEDERKTIPYLHIFSLLSSLKQICDHPALYLKEGKEYLNYPSGKWELCLELLEEARESGQKVVIFSHYLGMLDIFEEDLKKKKILYASLRGSTSNRKEELIRFKEDLSCEVFLGSLHAAGLGIDLTAASVVIHYDRWWNAAKEDQATDRVYRIGQTRGVQVFKLVTKNSIEEKIDAMISRKKQLLESVLLVDNQDALKRFTREELMDLIG